MSFLILVSMIFYAWASWAYLIAVSLDILVNWFLLRWIRQRRKPVLVLGIILNVLLLSVCKYSGFMVDNLNLLLHKDLVLSNIILPVGLSFYTFQQIAYLVDAYRGETASDSFLDYALYILYFPKLLSGPIVLRDKLIPQFHKSAPAKTDWNRIACCFTRFVYGLSKKVLLADLLGKAVDYGYSNIDLLSCGDVWVVAFAYSFQIYFDFSGYSDMAIAVSEMLGIELTPNFNAPYQSLSINDFWKRWHISLTDFLRKYIYIPLGGNRKGRTRQMLNIMIIFLVSGIWHGANWTYILWGALHGLLSVLYRLFHKTYDSLHVVFRWGINFVLVAFLWLLFRADSIRQWSVLMQRALKFENLQISAALADRFRMTESIVLYNIPVVSGILNKIPLFYPIAVLLFCLFITLNMTETGHRTYRINLRSLIVTALLLAWCMMAFATVSTYVYFGF